MRRQPARRAPRSPSCGPVANFGHRSPARSAAPSMTGGETVAPVTRARDVAVLEPHDGLPAAEEHLQCTTRTSPRILADMAHCFERLDDILADRRFETHRATGIVAEPPGVESLLHIHPEQKEVEEKLNVSLWLLGAADDSKAEPRRRRAVRSG